MTSRQTTQSEKALQMLSKGGIIRLREFMARGIAQETIARLTHQGRITQLSRGVYQLPDAELDIAHGLAHASKRVPRGIICLVSALQFHELTVQLPRAIWMAIPTGARTPRVDYPPMRFVRFSAKMHAQGIERHTIEGVTVRVTDPAHTIVDCFRSNRIGLDVALEGLREGLHHKRSTPDKIVRAAKHRRIWPKLRPYLEATV